MGLSLSEWHTPEYEKEHNIVIENEFISEWLAYTVIFFILSSILLEIAKGIIGVIALFSTKRRRKSIKPSLSSKQDPTVEQSINSELNERTSLSPKKKTILNNNEEEKELYPAKVRVKAQKKVKARKVTHTKRKKKSKIKLSNLPSRSKSKKLNSTRLKSKNNIVSVRKLYNQKKRNAARNNYMDVSNRSSEGELITNKRSTSPNHSERAKFLSIR